MDIKKTHAKKLIADLALADQKLSAHPAWAGLSAPFKNAAAFAIATRYLEKLLTEGNPADVEIFEDDPA